MRNTSPPSDASPASLSLPLDACIAKLWGTCLEDIQAEDLPGRCVEDMISDAENRAVAELPPVVAAWRRIFDEFLMWFSSVAIYLQEDLRLGRTPAAHKIAYGLLAGAAASQMTAIRKLVTAGLDVPAKQVLRGLCEYFDVLSLLIIKPELVPEFQKTQDSVTSNRFWHSHISRRRLKEIISQHILQEASEAHIKQWKEWKKLEDSVLSMAIHPSYIACTMSNYSFDKEITGLSIFGRSDSASVRTLSYTIFASAEAVILLTIWLHQNRDNSELFDNTDVEPILLTIVQKGGYVLMAALMGLCTEERLHPELVRRPSS